MVKIGEIERKEGQEVCEFEYLTRGRVSPNGRQYVYFTCHPDDFDSHFSEIVQIVLKKYDCAVWYNLNQLDDEKEYTHRLGEMQLFIIPITKNFLTEPCRARNIDLPFALNHFIPVLPLMQTSGLNESFEKICGDLHYIDKNACDETTLTYEQKIHKFLSMSLISDDLTRKIREAFYARIFLSYRKKDRAFANKLMGLIHDVPFCRDIAIWFDEYLVPGQNFNDAIADAMRNRKSFRRGQLYSKSRISASPGTVITYHANRSGRNVGGTDKFAERAIP